MFGNRLRPRLSSKRPVLPLCHRVFQSMMPHSGQAGVNQLGGLFVNGRPLPGSVRRQIVELAEMGVRPCDISRQLLVSHGCVSKILSRYYDTGSISPGSVTSTQKIKQTLPPLVQWKLAQFKSDDASVSAKEARELLIAHRVYDDRNAPSLLVLARVLKAIPPTLQPTSPASDDKKPTANSAATITNYGPHRLPDGRPKLPAPVPIKPSLITSRRHTLNVC